MPTRVFFFEGGGVYKVSWYPFSLVRKANTLLFSCSFLYTQRGFVPLLLMCIKKNTKAPQTGSLGLTKGLVLKRAPRATLLAIKPLTLHVALPCPLALAEGPWGERTTMGTALCHVFFFCGIGFCFVTSMERVSFFGCNAKPFLLIFWAEFKLHRNEQICSNILSIGPLWRQLLIESFVIYIYIYSYSY